MEAQSRALVGADTPVRYRLPSDDTVDGIWTDSEYDDARWAEGRFPIGFDTTPLADRGKKLTDSEDDWSWDGEQGARGWSYGYWNRSADVDDRYAPDEFIPFPNQGDEYGPNQFWNDSGWVWFEGEPPWTSIHRRNMHPNGVNNGAEHWPIRRWENTENCSLVVDWRLWKVDRGSAGITGYVMHNGDVIDQQALAGDDSRGIHRDALILNAEPSDVIDFAVSPVAPDGNSDDFQDRTALKGDVYCSARLNVERGTPLNIGADTPMYTRTRFAVEDLAPGGRTFLRLQYDDGFAAYLNGELIQVRNEPSTLQWDSRAQRNKSDNETRDVESFEIDEEPLQAGDHQLAIHILPAHGNDGRLWINAQLDYVFAVLVQDEDPDGPMSWIYTQFETPTPGAPNVLLE